jgi:Bacterial low temperature requirement A protein (LtrA)
MAVFEREDEQRLLRPPRLRTLEEGAERRATYLELFFDLVFVVAIAQLSHELVLDHSLGGFATFAALYLPVFIAWQGFSSYADRFDTDDIVFRAVMFLAMLAIAALAIQIPDVSHGESAGFVLAYVILRSLLVALYLRLYVHVPEARPLIGRYAWQYSIAIGIWVGSLAFPSPFRYVLWGVAVAWELSVPWLARRLYVAMPLHASHVPERLALFMLIVLGETIVVVALGTSGSEWALSAAVVASLGFLVAAAIWWTYFGGGGEVTLRPDPAAVAVFVLAHPAAGGVDGGERGTLPSDRAVVVLATGRWSSVGARRGSRPLPGVRYRRTRVERPGCACGCASSTDRSRPGARRPCAPRERARPVVFMAAAASVLVGVVLLELWTAQRLLRSSAA